jgi:IPT/TIG domain
MAFATWLGREYRVLERLMAMFGMRNKPFGSSRGAIFFLQLVYLAALMTAAVLYFTDVIHPRHFIGSVPTAVPWFGALGGVVISLTGVFEHNKDWLQSYRYWHWARPAIGAVAGTIAVLIFQAGILAVGESVKPSGTSASKNLLYYLIAFFVGYREDAFREMMKRLGNVILVPAAATAADIARIVSIEPTESQLGGTSVTVTGTGLSNLHAVKFGDVETTEFGPISDIQVTFTAPPVDGPRVVTLLLIFRDGSALGRPFTYHQ